MNCPSCGTDLPETAKFCGSCGYQMLPAAAVAAPAPAIASPMGSVPAVAGAVPSYEEIASRGLELPVGELVGEAWELSKNQLGLLVGGAFVLFMVYGVAANIPFAGLIVGGPLLGGLNIVVLRMVAGRETLFGNFFDGFKKFVPLMLLNLVMGLMIGFGALLLLLPGLYLAIAFTWAQWLVIDRDEEFWPALMASMKIVNGSFGATLVFMLAMGGINLLGALACGLGMLVTWPVTLVATGLAFRRNFGVVGGAERLGL